LDVAARFADGFQVYPGMRGYLEARKVKRQEKTVAHVVAKRAFEPNFGKNPGARDSDFVSFLPGIF